MICASQAPLTGVCYAAARRQRTELGQATRVARMLQPGLDNASVQEMGKACSSHPVRSALYGLGVVDVHEKLTHESLHNHNLGVTPMVVHIIVSRVRGASRGGPARRPRQRARLVRTSCRHTSQSRPRASSVPCAHHHMPCMYTQLEAIMSGKVAKKTLRTMNDILREMPA